MEAVKELAGMDESKPVIYPKAEALLARMDLTYALPIIFTRTLAPLPGCHFSLRDCRAGAPACHLIGKRERLPYGAAAAKLTMTWKLHPNCDVC
jgi:hypothetical protein